MSKFSRRNGISLGKISLVLISLMMALQVNSNVIGFDFGSTFFKITLVKPGQPFSIVENLTSARKTQTSVTITEETRLWGPDSFMESSKYPLSTYTQLH